MLFFRLKACVGYYQIHGTTVKLKISVSVYPVNPVPFCVHITNAASSKLPL